MILACLHPTTYTNKIALAAVLFFLRKLYFLRTLTMKLTQPVLFYAKIAGKWMLGWATEKPRPMKIKMQLVDIEIMDFDQNEKRNYNESI